MKTLLIVRLANDNLFILPFHQSNKVVACDCHCFNNCLISKVCAQISNSLSYTQISKRPSAAITYFLHMPYSQINANLLYPCINFFQFCLQCTKTAVMAITFFIAHLATTFLFMSPLLRVNIFARGCNYNKKTRQDALLRPLS